jgi:hypothetical protein
VPAKAYPLPEWTPDLANNVLTVAKNVRAIANGYAPVKGPQAVTTALPAVFNGGGAFIDSAGDSTLIAAADGFVQTYDGSAWNATTITSGSQVVRFAQFGDNILVANGSTLKSYGLISATVSTPTDAPDLIDVAQVRDFVMGITTDNQVQWSQFNDSGTWTTGTNQADTQPILSSQGVRIIGGEYGILVKKQGITRITYVGVVSGLDIVWQFDEISAEVGCMASGSVCNVGRLIFFLSERGFMMCDGNEVTPIADEKFNRWLFSNFSRADIEGISGAIDPRNSLVLWAMPGSPGVIIAYNWILKRATTFEMNVAGMFTGYTSGISLDALDAIYGDLDSIPISLDDPSLSGGNPILLIADNSSGLNALTGANLEAKFRLENIEPTPGKRSRIRSLRLLSDSTTASAKIDARMRPGDTEGVVSAAIMRTNGKLPIRCNGRYNTLEVTIPASTNWSFIQGCELEFEAGDGR